MHNVFGAAKACFTVAVLSKVTKAEELTRPAIISASLCLQQVRKLQKCCCNLCLHWPAITWTFDFEAWTSDRWSTYCLFKRNGSSDLVDLLVFVGSVNEYLGGLAFKTMDKSVYKKKLILGLARDSDRDP